MRDCTRYGGTAAEWLLGQALVARVDKSTNRSRRSFSALHGTTFRSFMLQAATRTLPFRTETRNNAAEQLTPLHLTWKCFPKGRRVCPATHLHMTTSFPGDAKPVCSGGGDHSIRRPSAVWGRIEGNKHKPTTSPIATEGCVSKKPEGGRSGWTMLLFINTTIRQRLKRGE